MNSEWSGDEKTRAEEHLPSEDERNAVDSAHVDANDSGKSDAAAPPVQPPDAASAEPGPTADKSGSGEGQNEDSQGADAEHENREDEDSQTEIGGELESAGDDEAADDEAADDVDRATTPPKAAQPLQEDEEVKPLEENLDDGDAEETEESARAWYILKVQVNREDSIRDAIIRRIKIEGLDQYFGQIVVPTEDVAEFNKSGKRRIVKRKLYPGYILIDMVLNDETWFVVRETPGVGDFTGSVGKPTPMDPLEVERILRTGTEESDGEAPVKTAIPFKAGDRVRVKDGYFQNFEGDVEVIDEANGRITVMINIFGRSTPVELEHWQVESV